MFSARACFIVSVLLSTGCLIGDDPNRPVDPGYDGADSGEATSDPTPGGPGSEFTGPPNFTLNCPAGRPELDADVAEAWADEAAAQGARGLSATFELHGEPYQVVGETVVNISGDITVFSEPTASGASFLFLPDAVTDAGDGFVALELADASEPERVHQMRLVGAELGDLRAEALEVGVQLQLTPSLDDPGYREIALPDDWGEGSAALPHVRGIGHSVGRIEIPAYKRGVIVTASNETIRLRPDESITIERASDLLFEPRTVLVSQVPPDFEAQFDTFALAGDFERTNVELDGVDATGLTALMGLDAQLGMDSARLATLRAARVTQGLDDGGLLLPAEVEIAPNTGLEIEIPRGERRRVTFSYREASFVGDAVLSDIRIEPEEATEVVELTVARGLLIEKLIASVENSGYLWPVVAVGAVVFAPFVVAVDIVRCIFGMCPERPQPFPSWMGAGAVGTFEIEFSGEVEVGVYDLVLTFVGQNFCEVPVSISVVVL